MLRKISSLLFFFSTCISALPTSRIQCEVYNYEACQSGEGLCNGTKICPEPEEEGKKSHCFAYWTNTSGVVRVLLKDCWLPVSSQQCYDSTRCIGENTHDKTFYCCCEGNLCNSVLHAADMSLTTTLVSVKAGSQVTSEGVTSYPGNDIVTCVLVSLLPLLVFATITVLVFWYCRRKILQRRIRQLSITSEVPSLLLKAVPPLVLHDVDLLELKGHGRFSKVWKARLTKGGSLVAVKIYPEHDRCSWLAESEFYSQPLVSQHENILKFIASERRGCDFWLITEYHEVGSLYDYLKSNMITLPELVVMATSMCRGLSFMHSSGGSKRAVAHRDVKSRNVLLRHDMTTCIADFGLALTLNSNPGDVHGQVGTNRYMAPEILDGSINFSIECFLKIDVYACALVLWELLSRCALEGNSSSYSMPFEDLVGSNPSLEDMQNIVVNQKVRPQLKQSWQQDEMLSSLCITIEESWDQDPEARLSADCINARLVALAESLAAPSTARLAHPTPVVDMSKEKIDSLLRSFVDESEVLLTTRSREVEDCTSESSIEKISTEATMP